MFLKEVGDIIHDLVGPLGNPGEITYYGRVCIVGGGVAIASAYERARRLKDAGNSIVAIIGAKTAKSLIYREEFRSLSNDLYITTEDGSEGVRGYVSDAFTELLNSGKRFDLEVVSKYLSLSYSISHMYYYACECYDCLEHYG